MKLFLKGGSVIEVSDKEYFCVITDQKVGFSLIESKREDGPWRKSGSYIFEDFIVPRDFVERVEL